ncbi:hypothetical protein B0H14DRAFT_3620045 [Mycena olivaceomarginata]|nr:hypothetical protein B0H14DRAFT_3620045 [Mycena olivaceomarginata]
MRPTLTLTRRPHCAEPILRRYAANSCPCILNRARIRVLFVLRGLPSNGVRQPRGNGWMDTGSLVHPTLSFPAVPVSALTSPPLSLRNTSAPRPPLPFADHCVHATAISRDTTQDPPPLYDFARTMPTPPRHTDASSVYQSFTLHTLPLPLPSLSSHSTLHTSLPSGPLPSSLFPCVPTPENAPINADASLALAVRSSRNALYSTSSSMLCYLPGPPFFHTRPLGGSASPVPLRLCLILLSSLPPVFSFGIPYSLTSIALLAPCDALYAPRPLHVTADTQSTPQDPSTACPSARYPTAPHMLRTTPPGRPDKLKLSRPLVQVTSVFSLWMCRLESIDLLIEDASQFMDTAHFPNLSAF